MPDPRSRSERLTRINVRSWASEALLCRSCGEQVTGDCSRINVTGAHRHDFFNPQRVHYAISCFSDAGGCCTVGEQSERATWFPGYVWRVAFCRRCGIHLGWCFVSAGGGHCFFGLVGARLVRLGEVFGN